MSLKLFSGSSPRLHTGLCFLPCEWLVLDVWEVFLMFCLVSLTSLSPVSKSLSLLEVSLHAVLIYSAWRHLRRVLIIPERRSPQSDTIIYPLK